MLSPEQVARSIVRGVEQRKPYILPNFEGWLYFALTNRLVTARLVYWYIDRLVKR